MNDELATHISLLATAITQAKALWQDTLAGDAP